MFSCCTVRPDSKENELGINQEASPSAGKNTRLDLLPCRVWKHVLTATDISGGVDISEVPGCY